MQSLIPITSSRSSKNIEILINPNQLAQFYGITSIKIMKTSIHTSSKEWCVELIESGKTRTIFDSEDQDISKDPSGVDIIKLLGHGLTIMNGQTLQVRSTNDYCSAICYLEDAEL